MLTVDQLIALLVALTALLGATVSVLQLLLTYIDKMGRHRGRRRPAVRRKSGAPHDTPL
jgi:hypothetical protein